MFHKNHNCESFDTDDQQVTSVLTLPQRFWRVTHEDAHALLRQRIQQQYNAQMQVCVCVRVCVCGWVGVRECGVCGSLSLL